MVVLGLRECGVERGFHLGLDRLGPVGNLLKGSQFQAMAVVLKRRATIGVAKCIASYVGGI